jgi:hypothetical protein
MSDSEMATIKDVWKAFRFAKDCITVVTTVQAHVAAGVIGPADFHTEYNDDWRRSFDDKANALVRIIAEELGQGWTRLPPGTPLGPRAQIAFREVRDLLARQE